ncbi:MAG: adenine phosphoribosyltransferase [Acidimicrobiales bacterium]
MAGERHSGFGSEGSRLVEFDYDLIRGQIRDVADFPKPGIVFKDITPLLGHAGLLAEAVDAMAKPYAAEAVDKVIGIEARGFMVATPVATRLGAGFVPARKAGKLPGPVESENYALEYGTDSLEVHSDAFGPGDRVLIVDDVIATGGTASAAARLAERLGADVVGFAFLVELAFLGGRSRLGDYRATSVVSYT